MSTETVYVTAAAWLWAVIRHERWDPERDDPADVLLHERVMTEARSRWPWLDDKADELEASL